MTLALSLLVLTHTALLGAPELTCPEGAVVLDQPGPSAFCMGRDLRGRPVRQGPFRVTWGGRERLTGAYVDGKRHGTWVDSPAGEAPRQFSYYLGQLVGGEGPAPVDPLKLLAGADAPSPGHSSDAPAPAASVRVAPVAVSRAEPPVKPRVRALTEPSTASWDEGAELARAERHLARLELRTSLGSVSSQQVYALDLGAEGYAGRFFFRADWSLAFADLGKLTFAPLNPVLGVGWHIGDRRLGYRVGLSGSIPVRGTSGGNLPELSVALAVPVTRGNWALYGAFPQYPALIWTNRVRAELDRLELTGTLNPYFFLPLDGGSSQLFVELAADGAYKVLPQLVLGARAQLVLSTASGNATTVLLEPFAAARVGPAELRLGAGFAVANSLAAGSGLPFNVSVALAGTLD